MKRSEAKRINDFNEIEDYLHREGFKKLTEAETYLPEWKYSIESCRQIIKERSKDEISVL